MILNYVYGTALLLLTLNTIAILIKSTNKSRTLFFISCSTSHMESIKSVKVATKICDTKPCMHLNQLKIMLCIAYYRNQRLDSVVSHK